MTGLYKAPRYNENGNLKKFKDNYVSSTRFFINSTKDTRDRLLITEQLDCIFFPESKKKPSQIEFTDICHWARDNNVLIYFPEYGLYKINRETQQLEDVKNTDENKENFEKLISSLLIIIKENSDINNSWHRIQDLSTLELIKDVAGLDYELKDKNNQQTAVLVKQALDLIMEKSGLVNEKVFFTAQLTSDKVKFRFDYQYKNKDEIEVILAMKNFLNKALSQAIEIDDSNMVKNGKGRTNFYQDYSKKPDNSVLVLSRNQLQNLIDGLNKMDAQELNTKLVNQDLVEKRSWRG